MKAINISLQMVSAFENYEAGVDACRHLGKVAQCHGRSFQALIADAKILAPGYTWDDMNPPAYYGAIFITGTNKSQIGKNPDETALLIWCGVSVKDAYVLRPRQKHIPELHAGVALWIERNAPPDDVDEVLSRLNKLEEYGFSINIDDEDDTLVRSAIIRKSFFELLMTDDTTAAAEAFFTHAFLGLGGLGVDTYEKFRGVTDHQILNNLNI